MKSVGPAFDPLREFWLALPDDPQSDIRTLENTITSQSSELNARLTEILELYNVQARQADELEAARAEIDRLKQKITALQRVGTQQIGAVAAAHEKISFVVSGAADNQNFKFNAVGVALEDITVDTHTPALVAKTGAFNGDGTGNFNFGITCDFGATD